MHAVSYLAGVALFAVGIAITIALHEWGHLTVAKWSGMQVRRYFIGFGPTLFSFKSTKGNKLGNETEYGLKAIPLGGFCDIAGMTAEDPVTEDEAPHAMWRRPWWQRIAVLLGGIGMNILLGLVIAYGVAVAWGLPNTSPDLTPIVSKTTCVATSQSKDGTLAQCSGDGPAAAAGIKPGDIIRSVDGTKTTSFAEVATLISQTDGDSVRLGVQRDAESKDITEVTVPVERVQRVNTAGEDVEIAAIGVSHQPDTSLLEYNALTAVPGTLKFAGDMISATFQALASLPAKIPGVVAAIFGAERAQDSPMSVVGASLLGGELVERSMWQGFLLMLVNLNFFLAAFNLIPLPPLDGGHVAVVLYERVRDAVRKRRGLAPAGPADYNRLMPITFAMAALLIGLGAVTIIADVVNPIRLF